MIHEKELKNSSWETTCLQLSVLCDSDQGKQNDCMAGPEILNKLPEGITVLMESFNQIKEKQT